MIPGNGTIEIKLPSAGGSFDDEGNPVAVADGWSEAIPCRIVTNSRNVEGKYKDGQFVQSSYHVFIDGSDEMQAERVRLTRQGVFLGEFPVQNNEYLRLVRRNKITV